MSFLSPKIVLIFVLLLAIVVVGSLIFLPNKPTSPTLPVQKMESPSPSPTHQAPVLPLPSFSPPAVPYEQLTKQQKEQNQNKADEYYQKTQDAVLKNYPWYLNLPLQGSGYFVYFDPPSEHFKTSLYPRRDSSVSVEDQVSRLKDAVIKQIATLGPDTGRYVIDWEINPK